MNSTRQKSFPNSREISSDDYKHFQDLIEENKKLRMIIERYEIYKSKISNYSEELGPFIGNNLKLNKKQIRRKEELEKELRELVKCKTLSIDSLKFEIENLKEQLNINNSLQSLSQEIIINLAKENVSLKNYPIEKNKEINSNSSKFFPITFYLNLSVILLTIELLSKLST